MIKRDLYTKPFIEDCLPNWICPTCNSSVLKINSNKFLSEFDSSTEVNKYEDWFDMPEMASLTFTTLLSCSNDNCKEVVSCTGDGFIEQKYLIDNKGRSFSEFITYYRPIYFYPPLNFFIIPENTPSNVSKSILESFSLFFTNKSSSANQIRVALECLLTHLKIKRFNTKNGKRNRLNLHQRIDLLPAKYQSIKNLCFAIKWLGNSGSHCGEELTSDNIFDGYDLLSALLDELYHNKQEHAKKLAKKINTKKGV